MSTVNLQLFKLVLEKAEEPEIKLSTPAGSWKKQESSRKTSISALLTMPKPLTVWITINCGRINIPEQQCIKQCCTREYQIAGLINRNGIRACLTEQVQHRADVTAHRQYTRLRQFRYELLLCWKNELLILGRSNKSR